jgi:hypothetical protein
MQEHEENWRSYPIESEGTMGFTMTDLGWGDAPDDHPWCLRLAVELTDPGPEGLGGSEEMEALSVGEDAFLEAVAETGVIHVARVRLGGEVAWFLYAPTDELLEKLGNAAAEALQRDVSVGSQHDPGWGIYTSLLPSPAVERWMGDCEVIEVLEQHGDPLVVPREVIHYAYFEEREDAERFASEAEEDGFTVELNEPTEELPQFGVVLTHASAVDLDTISEITQHLSEQADEMDGEYDGWECQLVKGPGGTMN